MPPMKFSAMTKNGRRLIGENGQAEGKPRFHGFESAGRRPAGIRRKENLTVTWGPEGFRRSSSRSSSGFGRLKICLGNACAAISARRASSTALSWEDLSASRRGQDVAAALTVTLEEADQGVIKRMRLPTGKDVEVRIPAGIANGAADQLKAQGLAGYSSPIKVLLDHGRRCAASGSSVEPAAPGAQVRPVRQRRRRSRPVRPVRQRRRSTRPAEPFGSDVLPDRGPLGRGEWRFASRRRISGPTIVTSPAPTVDHGSPGRTRAATVGAAWTTTGRRGLPAVSRSGRRPALR